MDEISRLRIIALGASLTSGTPGFRSPRERPPLGEGNEQSQYAYWMMKLKPEWEVLNRGMRGQRTDQIAMRFDYDVIENRPDYVIIIAGTNDLYQGYGTAWALEHLEKMYDRAREAGIGVLAGSILPLNLASSKVKDEILQLNRGLERLTQKKEIGFCDLYKIMEAPENAGFIANSPDQVHPDVSGYRKIGEALTAALEDLIRRKKAET